MNIAEEISIRFKKSKALGAAFAIFDQGKIDFFYHGVEKVSGNAISATSQFELGSITKIFTATLLMDFSIRQMVALSDPIGKFFPFLKGSRFKTGEITLEHLATHYSGLPNIPANLVPADVKNPYIDYTVESLYAFLKKHKLQTALGEKFEYSNLGFGLLGHILSLVSKTTYEQLVANNIFNRLSMNHSSFLNTSPRSAQLCQGHFMQQPIPSWGTSEVFMGAVGICSSIKDMAQLLMANLKTSPLSDLFSRSHRLRYSYSHNESIGLGWLIRHSKDGDTIWHDGITAGFQSFIGFHLQQNKGIVALCNSSANWIAPLSFEILSSTTIFSPELNRAIQ